MSKTYLITGATSPLGLALMGRLLPALEEGDLILAQGCGDLARLAGLSTGRPVRRPGPPAEFPVPGGSRRSSRIYSAGRRPRAGG